MKWNFCFEYGTALISRSKSCKSYMLLHRRQHEFYSFVKKCNIEAVDFRVCCSHLKFLYGDSFRPVQVRMYWVVDFVQVYTVQVCTGCNIPIVAKMYNWSNGTNWYWLPGGNWIFEKLSVQIQKGLCRMLTNDKTTTTTSIT